MHLVHRAEDGALLVVGVFLEEGGRHESLDGLLAELPEREGDALVRD